MYGVSPDDAKPDGTRSRRTDSPNGWPPFYQVWCSGVSDPTDLVNACVEAEIDAMREWLRRTGRDRREPNLEQIISYLRHKWRVETETKFRGYGVPANLVRLLQAPSKRGVERIAGEITVSGPDLGLLAFNAKILGYRHRFKERRFMPEHLIAAFDEVGDALEKESRGSPKLIRALGKVPEMVRQRKHLFSHMFEKGAKWHCFFFDFNDWREHGDTPHIHYVDHHWGKPLDRDVVWNALDEPRNSLPRLHLKFVEMATYACPEAGGKYRTFSPADVMIPEGYAPKKRRPGK